MKTQIFEKNPINAVNYHIPEVAKREKSPLEILEDRFARGEISDIKFANKLGLLKLRQDYIKEVKADEKEEKIEVKIKKRKKN